MIICSCSSVVCVFILQAEVQGRRADAMTFYGLSQDWAKMASLLGRELADRLNVNAEGRAFWQENGHNVLKLLDNEAKTNPNIVDEVSLIFFAILLVSFVFTFFVHFFIHDTSCHRFIIHVMFGTWNGQDFKHPFRFVGYDRTVREEYSYVRRFFLFRRSVI